MSQNPFKIISPTEQPPEELKKEVMGSVKTVILLLRFVQLFVADQANLIFDNLRLLSPPKRNNDHEGMDGQVGT